MPELSEPKHFAYIDTVRGLAFFGVLLCHTSECVGPFPFRSTFLQGWLGVQLFFLASAITLSFSMETRRKVDPHPCLFFYVRRLFRIAPLFWLAMIFYWTFPGVMPRFWLGQYAPDGVKPSYFILTALFLHGWHPLTFNSIVPGGWSIAVEMNFYLIFPLCFYYLDSLKKALAAMLAGLLLTSLEIRYFFDAAREPFFYPGVPAGIVFFFHRFWFPSQMAVFLVGIATYRLLRTQVAREVAADRFSAVLVLGFCGAGLLSLLRGTSHLIPDYLIDVILLAGLIIVLSGRSIPGLVNPFLCYLGKISYSCYLAHFAALGITLQVLGIRLTEKSPAFDAGDSWSNLGWFVLIVALSLALTVAFSSMTLHLVENPGIALGRRFLHWIGFARPRPPRLAIEKSD